MLGNKRFFQKYKHDELSSYQNKFKLIDSIYITIKEFKGDIYIDIRKNEERNGKTYPTTKGITLSRKQWEELYKFADLIDSSIDALEYQIKP